MPNHPDRVRRNYDTAPKWRSPSDNAADWATTRFLQQWDRVAFTRPPTRLEWNVIEAEEFDTNRDAGDEND